MAEYINLQAAKENIVSLTTYNGEEEIRQAVKSARYKEDQWIGGIHDALISLSEIPVADVVEVVRCKDCDLWNEWDESGHKKLGNYACSCAYFSNEDGYMVYTGPDDYCSYGERKEDKA